MLKSSKLMEALVNNALDFLKLATDELDERPKHSVINFYSAVELFLKARLMHEHWSLVVQKNPDFLKFQQGDFVSVTFEESCERLKRIVRSPMPDETRDAFEIIRRHRNRMVHFFHEIDSESKMREQVAREELNAWHGLESLLRVRWKDEFDPYEIDLKSINRTFSKHRFYFQTRYAAISAELEELKKRSAVIVNCRSCGFPAAEQAELLRDLHSTHCHVCGLNHVCLLINCDECSETIRVEGEGRAVCENCNNNYSIEELASSIDETRHDPRDPDSMEGINCSFCDGYHSVVAYQGKYLCVSCLDLSDDISHCGWCHEANTGDMEESDWKGCNFCDGRSGKMSDE